MPTREQTERSLATVEAAQARLKGVLMFDYVVPDFYARFPKPVHGRMGAPEPERHALRAGAALPRRREASRASF